MKDDNRTDGTKLVGVLLLTFVGIILILLRAGFVDPIYTSLLVLSVISLAVVVYQSTHPLVPILYVMLVLTYIILTVGKLVGIGIQLAVSFLVLLLLIYMFYLTKNYILIIPFAVDLYLLLVLLQLNAMVV